MRKTLIEVLLFALVILLVEIVKSVFITKSKEDGSRFDISEVRFETYVFFDELNVLHTDSECQGLKNATQYTDAKWVKISELTKNDITKMCSRCVTDEQSRILRHNTK